ncbi:glycosyltransferase family 39 protein [Candidatus Gottesmanbacteria bacterium]|nr:glycosyltransferase family 39 protein [Candidatus Gottesmanbacteria bacterium]
MKISRQIVFLIFILLIAGFLRFYNLMFDAPYFANPDERNMANAITQFHFPENLNPNFFAYGQLPLYLAFFSDQISQLFTTHYSLPTTFSSAIFYLRFYSALSSILTVLMVYLISKELFKNLDYLKFLAALFAAFTPGLIQSAHFGTTESLLTFFFITSVYLSIKYLNSHQKFIIYHLSFIILASLIIGLAIGTKLTGIFCLIPPLLVLTIDTKQLKLKVISILFLILGSLAVFLLTSPYNFLALDDFKSAVFGYEQDVATGRYKAFYTVQFEKTIPILFQLEKIFPYALGWPQFLIGLLGLVLLIKRFRVHYILIISFLIYVLANAFLYAKWTRFLTPIFPLFSIFSAYFLFQILKFKRFKLLATALIFALCTLSLLPGAAFMSIYTHPDTRVQASRWIYQNIPNNSYILSETANVVDIPLPPETHNLQPTTYNLNIVSFDFYHLDENPILFENLLNHLQNADYIFIPSRRIFANYARLPEKYPILSKYYEFLFSGQLGFAKVAEITSYPKIDSIQFPDENAEETWTVFDHPVVRIYKNTNNLTKNEYTSLFEN